MNQMNSQSQKPHNSSKHNKRRLREEQVRLLETSFVYNKKLEPEQKLRLARELNIPPRQIAVWYQNRRARWRTQSLEVEYSALELRLEATLAEKKRLERDVERLRGELDKAHEMLQTVLVAAAEAPLMLPPPPPPPLPLVNSLSSESSSCDQDVGLGFSWVNINNGDHEGLRLEEMYAYACLMNNSDVSHSG